MKKRVLIVHPVPDMADTIEDLLSELESEDDGYDLTFGRARSRAAAEAYAKPVDLVVTAVEIPADNNSPLPAGEQRRLGMELFRTLHTKKPEIEAIFVTDHVDDAIDSFSRTEHVPLAPEGENFRENLRLAASQALGPPRPRRAILTITLGKDHCSYEFQSEGAKRGSRYPLVIDADQLNELVEESQSVHVKDRTWPGALKRLGEKLAERLFSGPTANLDFRDAFHEWVGAVEGIENIKIRFQVEDLDLHPIAVEAVTKREGEPWEPWMVRTAIYRGLDLSGGGPGIPRPGLFQDDQTLKGPINFLIIAADVPPDAKAGDKDIQLLPLPSLLGEVSDIAKLLWTLKKRNARRIGEVRVIGSADMLRYGSPLNELKDLVKIDVPANGALNELVRDTLEKGGKWHVVHYVGHTQYDPQNNVGYVFFPCPGSNVSNVEAVKIAEFGGWLGEADTRLVFLSSCASASQDFIYQLAKQHVPAIIGFLWEVADAQAREYATSFYQLLLEGRDHSLESACLAAKKKMYQKYSKKNPIWASSVLVQTS